MRGGREGGNWEGGEAEKKVVGRRGYSYTMCDPISVLYNAVVFHSVLQQMMLELSNVKIYTHTHTHHSMSVIAPYVPTN